ncbi:MAG: hypothetical protein IPP87_17385 [Ideonella sp.]|nr:hypothetical protein [Ideonella sp.]MBL0150354.1 hypothetical protein [Ideonella sp.]
MRERFNTVAVAIPAQQFHVRCHVSIERQVPVMTDFAVRLLHLAGPLEVGSMQEYFGLSGNELIDLLELLRGEGLVEESGGRFALTAYAEGRFVGSSDGLPRFTRIAERKSLPVFELLSYTPIPKTLSGTYWDNALELDWASDEEGHGQTVERAEAAFHKHFLDIERFQQDEEWRRAFSCYKVDSITSGRPFNVPLPVHFDVDLDGNVEFDVDQQLDLLPDELRSRVRQLTADRIGSLKAHSDNFKGFVSFFEDGLLARYLPSGSVATKPANAIVQSGRKLVLRKTPDFDFPRYVREVHAGADGEVYDDKRSRALLGALYMPKNQDRVVEALASAADHFKNAATADTSFPSEILWVIPDTDLWGRTELVRGFIERLNSAVGKAWGEPVEVVGIAPAPQDETVERVRKRGNLLLDAGFSEVFLGPPIATLERFEGMVLPGVYGAAMYQWKVPSMDVLSVPVGFGTRSPISLRRLAALARNAGSSKLHRIRRGSGKDGEDKKLKYAAASSSDFLYLEAFIAE